MSGPVPPKESLVCSSVSFSSDEGVLSFLLFTSFLFNALKVRNFHSAIKSFSFFCKGFISES